MKKYKEIEARDLKEGSIVVKSHGYAERVESIVDVTENVKLITFSDSYDNIHEIYVRNDQRYSVRTEDIQEGKLFDRLVSQLKAKGMPEDKAYATATSQLQKHGSMKSGTRELTKHGKKREKMGASGRAKDRAAKKSGKKTSDYKYNPKTNGTTLKSHFEPQGEELAEENKPTNPALWSKAISKAKSKFEVYPSAYANGWASKWYKSQGGGWKKG